jgi:hypothetical protein
VYNITQYVRGRVPFQSRYGDVFQTDRRARTKGFRETKREGGKKIETKQNRVSEAAKREYYAAYR